MNSIVSNRPLISVVTVCYNAESTISRTIESVGLLKTQFPESIEYIIIDGGSVDDTVGQIKKHMHIYDLLISEPDKGIYDAMNKGLQLCNGTYVSFLNANDYFSTGSLTEVFQTLSSEKYDCVYGNICSRYNSSIKIIKPISEHRAIKYGYMTPIVMQPASFIKKIVYDKIGGFDLDFRIAGDTDFLIRFIKETSFNRFYIDTIFEYFDPSGISNRKVIDFREFIFLKNKNHIPSLKFARYIIESGIKKMIFRLLLGFNILYK
jgi:glycosyltransferase involved in cell wall biosynthesis